MNRHFGVIEVKEDPSEPLALTDGIFPPAILFDPDYDPLASHFIRAKRLNRALDGLVIAFPGEDGRMLRGFYRHF